MINETLRDIKGPLSLSNQVNFLLFLGILIVLVVLVLLWMYFKKRKKTPLAIPKRSAHGIAYEQFERLKEKDYIRQGRVKEYYSEISDIIRHYLENRFLLKAPEMTTEEFLFYVRDYGRLIEAHKALLKEFLISCDFVKFAKYIPSTAEVDAIFVSAKKLVDETKEDIPVK